MTQREKDEKLVELMKIGIRAEEIVRLYKSLESIAEFGKAITEMGELLDAFNAKWGEQPEITCTHCGAPVYNDGDAQKPTWLEIPTGDDHCRANANGAAHQVKVES